MSASTSNKRIVKNTLLLYVRMLFTMIIGLYTSRVVLQVLGVVDYGIYEVVGGVISLFTFLNTTMAAATQRFLTYEVGRGNVERLKRVFSTSLNIHIIICLLVLVLSELLGFWFIEYKLNIPQERLIAAHVVFQFSILTALFSITQVPYNALIVAHEKMGIYAYVSVLGSILKLLLVILVGIISYDSLILFAIALFVKEFFVMIIYRVYCLRNFKESSYVFIWDRILLKEIAGFAGWNLSAHLVNMAKTQGVSILLNIFHGPVCNAARGIACQVQGMLLQFSDNFQVATVPQITKNYAQGDVKGMNELIIRGSKISLSLLIIVMLPFIIETEKVLGIWLGQVPTHTVVFTRLCLIATLCNALSGLLVYGALATGNVKNYQIIMSSIISLQFFVVWYLFSKKANPEVMYITEIICYVIALFVRLVLLKKMVHFPVFRYLKDVFLKSLVLVCISLVIPYVLHTSIENNFCRIFVVFLTSVLISVLLTIMIILNQHERKIIFKALKSKLYH